eukprot:COSAG01_NODE_4923_length_4615_cov_3.525232_4_plen_298_part_00
MHAVPAPVWPAAACTPMRRTHLRQGRPLGAHPRCATRSESGARCFSWAGRGASFSWAGRALVGCGEGRGGHSPSARALRSASFLSASACPPSSAWSTSIASTGGCLGRSQPTRATETELQIAITVDQPALSPARTPAEPPPRPSPAAPPPRRRACAAAPPPGARRRPASPPAARACAPAQRGHSAGRVCQLGAAGPCVSWAGQNDVLPARGTLLGIVCPSGQAPHHRHMPAIRWWWGGARATHGRRPRVGGGGGGGGGGGVWPMHARTATTSERFSSCSVRRRSRACSVACDTHIRI